MQFNSKHETQRIIDWIREYFKDTDFKAIIGISGGKDSAVVAALCTVALGKDRVIGVMMPQGEQNLTYGMQLIQHLGIAYKIINIEKTVNAYIEEMLECGQEITDEAKINIPAAIRMARLYSVAAAEGGLVANTCNLSEDWIGYSTKFGDSKGDFSPLADYTVTEIKQIGTELGLPPNLVNKTPADDLQPLADEERIGFTYDILDIYIRTGTCANPEIKAKIDKMHKANLHKIRPMPKCEYQSEN